MCLVPTGCASRLLTRSPRRLYLAKASTLKASTAFALLLSSLLLLAAPVHAQSGSYTCPGPAGGCP